MKPKLAPGVRLRFDKINQEYLLLSPERGLRLNGTATAILRLCDGERSIAEIVDALKQRYKDARADEIQSLIEQLRGRGLIQ